ncbi:MAG TPA: beta-galactosidase [Chthoniobacterales bacterium]|jgi:hypothetical protein
MPRQSTLLILLLASLPIVPTKTQGQIPRGIFSLAASGQVASDNALANPDVVGMSIRQDWAQLEPSEGNFDWSYLDSEVARAAAAGKVVLLRIRTQGGKPAWVTTAIQNAAGTFFSFDDDGVPTTIPVFWDPTYLAKKKAMIAALGAHFTANSTVRLVAASFANAVSEDWNVPHTEEDVQNWLAAGYTTDKLLDAGKQVIDATMGAFPNQYVTLAIAGNGHFPGGSETNLDPTATYAAATAIATARASWPGRLIVQINSVSNSNPAAPGSTDSAWNTLWNSRPDVAGQMLDVCYGDETYRVNGGVSGDPATTLASCLIRSVTYGLNYLEVYQKDILNLPTTITYGSQLLGTAGAPSINISTRGDVGSDDDVLVGGLVVSGTATKRLILRALAPSLAIDGTTALLADPILELHKPDGSVVTNDNWRDTQEEEIIETQLAPANNLESAIVATLDPGAYTAIVRGKNGGTGVALIEAYDLDQTASSHLGNISTRGLVGTHNNVMIGGFILDGSAEASTIVVRGLGPTLSGLGVADALSNPALELHDVQGALIGSDDDWKDSQQAEIEASGLAPTDDRESAILAVLSGGAYTAILRGTNNSTGVGLIEVYNLP